MTQHRPGSPRGVAADVIELWLRTGAFPDRQLQSVHADRAFVMEVVYGVARWRRLLEWVVSKYAAREPDLRTLSYLLVGIYQLLLMDTVVPYAAVNETVEAVKRGSSPRTAGFVNGVLRRLLREMAPLRREMASLTLGVRESHPDVLVDRWRARFGEDDTVALCRWNNTRPHVTVGANALRASLDDLVEAFRGAGCEAVPHPSAAGTFLLLPHGVFPADLPGYKGGRFNVQDPSTAVAVDLLDAQEGQRVLDACAAPGGKTALIAAAIKDRGELLAMDLHEDRLPTLRSNLSRLKIKSARVLQGDARTIDPAELGGERSFDCILLDVPCTNTGVLRRRPDARWRFSEERVARLRKTQRAMLDHCSRLLKPGGRLVYSTCSLEPEEGEELIAAWVERNPSFTLARRISVFPPHAETDGVFAAALTTTQGDVRT